MLLHHSEEFLWEMRRGKVFPQMVVLVIGHSMEVDWQFVEMGRLPPLVGYAGL